MFIIRIDLKKDVGEGGCVETCRKVDFGSSDGGHVAVRGGSDRVDTNGKQGQSQLRAHRLTARRSPIHSGIKAEGKGV